MEKSGRMKKRIIVILFSIFFLIIMFIGYLVTDLNRNKINFSEVKINIEQNEHNYASVTNVQELATALENEQIQIIELKNDIDLGYNLVESSGIKTEYIQKHNEPLTHPILKETGVSKLKIKNRQNLIIYSKDGSKVLHTNIVIENSKNIKIDNVKMEELWEWDEETNAKYARNNWDYITIKNCENIQISNCEFSKSYDGTIDIKESKNVTIEYCKLNEIDVKKDLFYNAQFNYLEENLNNYPMYYFFRKEIGLSKEKIKELSAYQVKIHLIGPIDGGEKNENIVIHDSVYLNGKTRLPMARNSSVHVYNVYMDSSKINKEMLNGIPMEKIEKKYSKFFLVSTHGVVSRQRSYIVVENCVFKGLKHNYEDYRNKFIGEWGTIVRIENKDVMHNLKDRLDKEAGIKNYNY